MIRYDYKTRVIVQFDNGVGRASFSRKRYGDLLDKIVEQSMSLNEKIFNPYEIDGEIIKLLYWNGSEIVSIIIDKEDLEKVKNNYWTVNHNGYAHSRTNGEKTYLHWVITGTKTSGETVIDHINNNPLDNRKSNLRVTDYRGNNTNLKDQELKGVNKTSDGRGWRARWSVNGQDFQKGFYGEGAFEKAKEHRLKMMKETNYLRTCND